MAGVNQRTDADNSATADLLEKSVQAYDELLADFPDSPYNQKRYEDEELGNLERHIQELKSEKASEFYAWFRTQNPQKSDRRGPLDGLPSGHPPLDSGPVTLPQIPEGLRLPDEAPETGPVLPSPSSSGTPEEGQADSPAKEGGEADESATPKSPAEKTDGE